MERAINEVFEDSGVKVKCIETPKLIFACDHCFYDNDKGRCNTDYECVEDYREDGKDVHFIKVDEQ